MCEKNGPDSPSGLARTARSARLRFCLFRRFVFIQGVCLSRRAQRADLFKTSIRLSAKGVKYRDKSRRVWGGCIIIKLYRWLTICAKCVYYKGAINLINLGKDLYFCNRCIFRITQLFPNWACRFITKISGDALVIFLLDYLIPCGITAREKWEPKSNVFSVF